MSSTAAVAAPQVNRFRQVLLPSRSLPTGITLGPDGNMWFTESGSNRIGVINRRSGTITQFTVPTPASSPSGITAGPTATCGSRSGDGNAIASITTAGPSRNSPSLRPTAFRPGSRPDPMGTCGFTEFIASKIGRHHAVRGDHRVPHLHPCLAQGLRRPGRERVVRRHATDGPSARSPRRAPSPSTERPAIQRSPGHRAGRRWEPVVHRERPGPDQPREDRPDHPFGRDHRVPRARQRAQPHRHHLRSQGRALVHRRRPPHRSRRAHRVVRESARGPNGPVGIAVDPHGNIWFTEYDPVDAIGEFRVP
jgi:DNA-binding beta-propeller fold protein YncE